MFSATIEGLTDQIFGFTLRVGFQAIFGHNEQKSWNGVAILSRYVDIRSFKNGLPGYPEHKNSRYLEAIINDVIIPCLYSPNGNPATDPKFDYKSEWIKHFTLHTKKLFAQDILVVLAGDFNVITT